MARHLHGSGSEIEIRPGKGGAGQGGGYANFPEARRAALALLDRAIAAAESEERRRVLRDHRGDLAKMTAAEVPKDLLSGPQGVEMEAAMEMVQVELGREKLARRPVLAAFVVLLVAVLALLSLFKG